MKILSPATLAVVLVIPFSFGIGQPEQLKRGFTERSSRVEAGQGVFNAQRSKNIGHPTFVSPHANPIALYQDHVLVVNTPADTVDVIDSNSCEIVRRISVGVDPVSIAIRPDGLEVWVSNHVSDSVSVIDNDRRSPTYLHVVATIQKFDENGSTTFDEPIGIAFAGNEKAYVALSSEKQIAVIDVATRTLVKRLTIPAQDPRAIEVRNGKLYVIPFESNNKTQLSGSSKADIDGELVTFDAWEHSIVHNNVLSLGHIVDIVKHPEVPDRDLFVYDTDSDELIETVDSLGTLLYGMTVSSKGTVFLAQADARNDINGRAGTRKHDLSQLQNRAFLNQITKVDLSEPKESRSPEFINLEPLPPEHPKKGEALATPFAIKVSDDDATLVLTAAASDKLVTLDAVSGEILGRTDVGSVPRGIALGHADDGKLSLAWVLNAVANSVTLVDLKDQRAPTVIKSIPLEDPTHPTVKEGRIAFETAAASSTGTFACASCHPDGHTDQLLWVLKTPVVTGGNQIMPRSTMPVRGLRDTEPFHWDGIPGDPYGGNNSANVHGSDSPNANPGDPMSSIRHLIDAGLASTMASDEKSFNDEGKEGRLSSKERDAMATFLLSIPFPPAQRRPYSNEITEQGRKGFELFHILGDDDPSKPQPNVCGNCHRMPHLVSTNTPGTGMDAPTWRGAYDRFLILPQGRLNIVEFPFYRSVAERGQSEEEIWRFSWGGRERFNPIWDMVLEMSTGQSGAFGRQITLNRNTVDDEAALKLLEALETSALEGAIVLEATGVRVRNSDPTKVRLQHFEDGRYYDQIEVASYSRDELIHDIAAGRLLLTFTGHHGADCDIEHPQPAIWCVGPIEQQRGPQRFPVLYPGKKDLRISCRHVDQGARIFLDGRRVGGSIAPDENEVATILLEELPDLGMHLLQVQNPNGRFSNDFIINVVATDPKTGQVDRELRPQKLSEVLERAGWQALIGDWEDQDSQGAGLRLSFKWKIEGRVIESTSADPTRTSVSIIGINAANGDIFQVGADSTGSSHLGTWKFDKNEGGVLSLSYTSEDGTQGKLTLLYKLIDTDTLDLTIGQPQGFHIRLNRSGG